MPAPFVPLLLQLLLPIAVREIAKQTAAGNKRKEVTGMNEAVAAMLRHMLTALGGYFVAKGDLDPGAVESIAGGVVTIVGVIWSLVAKRQRPED